MKLIKDNIYEHDGKRYQYGVSTGGNACVSCVFLDGCGGCKYHSSKCLEMFGSSGYFKLYTEENKMTEQEIVKYWVNNRKEMRAFAAAPKECQEWLKKYINMAQVMSSVNNLHRITSVDVMSIPTIDLGEAEDYLKDKKESENGKFVEYDIEDSCFVGEHDNYVLWSDIHEFTQHNQMFGGWLFEDNDEYVPEERWSVVPMGISKSGEMTVDANVWVSPLVPIKIRFWVKG